MEWFWDAYMSDPGQRADITASPNQASIEQVSGLPPAYLCVDEADVLRDEGEAYAAKLRSAGVPVTTVRYDGTIHDFMLLNALADTRASRAAIGQATAHLRAWQPARARRSGVRLAARRGHVEPDLPACNSMVVGGKMARKFAAEFVGTALLVFFGVGMAALVFGFRIFGSSLVGGVLAVAIMFGLIYAALVYVIGPISGGHVNPAVSLGAFLARRITVVDLIGYWVAQMAGAIAGAALVLWLRTPRRCTTSPGKASAPTDTAPTRCCMSGRMARFSPRSCSPRHSCSSCSV